MSFSAFAYRLLISCPGDVPEKDLGIVHRAITTWNGLYGETFGRVVIPVSWSSHAAAEFGRSPQEIINDQLVDKCDICIAIFANRMGTPTMVAESGTAEEIARLNEAGCYVAVLRSRRPVDAATLDLSQASKLEEYMSRIQGNALVKEYRDDAGLESLVSTVLTAFVNSDKARSEVLLGVAGSTGASPTGADVWPKIETSEQVKTDSRGRLKTSKNWYLVLVNSGSSVAREVKYSFNYGETEGDEDEPWEAMDGEDAMERGITLAPNGGEVKFLLLSSFGSATQADCVVSWEDDSGDHQNKATLRLA